MSQQVSGLNQTSVGSYSRGDAPPKSKHSGPLGLRACRDLSLDYGTLSDSQLERLRDQIHGIAGITIALATSCFEKRRDNIRTSDFAAGDDSPSNCAGSLVQ
jgi:hypothetical protein